MTAERSIGVIVLPVLLTILILHWISLHNLLAFIWIPLLQGLSIMASYSNRRQIFGVHFPKQANNK